MADRRKLTHYIYIVWLLGSAVACSSNPSTQSASTEKYTKDDPSRGIICTDAAPTGSFVRVKRCTTPEQREQQIREAGHQMVVVPAPR